MVKLPLDKGVTQHVFLPILSLAFLAHFAIVLSIFFGLVPPAFATPYTETVPNGNGAIPNTYPAVGGTMFVLIGANGNIYYQFVNPSTQFQGFQLNGSPAAFRGNPFQLGPTQALNCGPTSCNDYFGGSIVEGYARLTARDGDACVGNFDYQDVYFEVNGIRVGSFSDLPANSVERTNFAGTNSIGFENCFRNQGSSETSTGWFELTGVPGLLNNILSTGSTTPYVFDDDGTTNGRGDNFWYFQDGNDATGTPEVAPGISIEKDADVSEYSTVGDVVNYTFLVTNIGSVTLTNVTVSDPQILGPITCPQTTLVSGAAMTCNANYTITQANIDQGTALTNIATVDATPTEGTLGNVSGEVTITGPAATPLATITKEASDDTNLKVGDVVTYTYTITNTGNVTLLDVGVSDAHGGSASLSALGSEVLTNISTLSVNSIAGDGEIDALSPGDSATIEATYIVSQADIDAQRTIDNTATLVATPARGILAELTADESVSVEPDTPSMSLTKIADDDTDVTVGQTISYTYTVENTGNVTLTNVSVSDVHQGEGTLSAIAGDALTNTSGLSSDASIDGVIDALSPGDAATFTATYVVTQADIDAGIAINNVATGTALPAGAGTLVEPVANESVSVDAPSPNYTLSKSADVIDDLELGDTVTYTYRIENTGNVTLTDVGVVDVHPGANALSAIAGDVLVNTSGLSADAAIDGVIDSLSPGDRATLTATYVVAQGDIDAQAAITNIATASATAPDFTVINRNDSETIRVVAPDVSLTAGKVATPNANVTAGTTVTYTYTVTNDGNVTIDDVTPVDAHSAVGSLSAIGSELITNTSGNSSDATQNGVVDSLAPGDSATFVATYVVLQADIDAQTDITNTVTIFGTPRVGSLVKPTANAVVSLDAPAPLFTLSKVASKDTDAVVGDVIIYTFTVVNTGNVTISDVSISDVHNGEGTLSVIAGDTLVNTSGLSADGSVDGSIDSLSPGDSATFTATYEVLQEDIDAQIDITNTATASGTSASGVLAAVDANEAVSVIAEAPVLAIDKRLTAASAVSFAAVGDPLAYEYIVTNTGNVTITGAISVADDKIDGAGGSVSCPAVLAPGLPIGDSITCTGTYLVQQEDIDLGFVTNTATATDGTTISPADSVTINAVQSPSLAINKFANPAVNPIDFVVGEVVTYDYLVTNDGNVTMTSAITVTDNLIPVVSCPALPGGILSPGTSITCSGTYTVTTNDVQLGSVTNTASATSGTTTSPKVAETIPAGANPAISLTKSTVTADFDEVGDIITYQFSVENTGNASLADDIFINDPLIAATTPNPCWSTSVGDPDFQPGSPGETIVCSATYTVDQDDLDRGYVLNEATAETVYAVTTDVVSPPSTARVDAITDPSLNVTKSVLPTTFTTAGQELVYTISVENDGNQTIRTINIVDPLLPALSCNIPILSPNQTNNSCTGTYTVTQDDVDVGTITNTASATGSDPSGGSVTDSDTLITNGPAADPRWSLDKTSTSTPTSDNDVVVYNFVLQNTGNVSLTGVLLNDPKCDVAPVLISGDVNPSGKMLPGETWNYRCDYTIDQDDVNTGSIVNNALATGTAARGTLADAPGTVTISITQTPMLSIEKIADTSAVNNPAEQGDEITYSFRVENTGNVTLTNVTVTDGDAIVSGGPIASMVPGQVDTLTFEAVHALELSDINDGSYSNQAMVTGTPPTGPNVTALSDDPSTLADGDATTVTLGTNPELTVIKSSTLNLGVDGRADEGDTITYAFAVENTGNVTLTGVTISDLLAPVTGGPITLLPGEQDTTTFEATYTITQPDIDAGSFANTATGFGRAPDGTPVSDVSDSSNVADGANDDDPTVTIIPAAPELELIKAGTIDDGGDGVVDEGDIANYTFTVTNTGNVTITNITISDLGATVSGGPIISLAPGERDLLTFEASRPITQPEIDAGFVSNTATVNGFDPDGDGVSDISDSAAPGSGAGGDDPTILDIPSSAMLDLQKVATVNDGGDGLGEGDTITYAFRVQNTGNVTLSDITISDLGATISGGPILSLEPGEIDTATFIGSYTIELVDMNEGSYSNQATVTGNPPTGPPISDLSDDPADPTGTDDPTVAELATSPSIALTKSADLSGLSSPIQVGDEVRYTFTVTNTGNVSLSDITLEDLGATVSGGPILRLDPGETDASTFEATYSIIQDDINDGSYSNQATVSGTPPTGPAVTDLSDDPLDATGSDDPTVVMFTAAPSIQLVKVADLSAMSSPIEAGDEIRYNFTVTNTGNITLTDVTLEDLGATVSGGPIETMDPGDVDTTTFSATYSITLEDINNGSYANQATVTGTPPTGPPVTDLSDDPSDPTGDDDQTVVTLEAARGLDIDKSLTSVERLFPYIYAIEYTIEVENTGNATEQGIQILDDLGAALAPASVIGSPTVAISGFGGTGEASATYDGIGNTDTIAGNAILDPEQIGVVTINVQVDMSDGYANAGNTAYGTSNDILTPIASDAPTVTPGDSSDVNPTPDPAIDADNDGAPDSAESDTADRDGDGIPDARDYDPTGYFYCQENGAILSGGQITVTGPSGSQAGVGSSSNITIIADGSNGFYQWHVSAAGTYTMSYSLPTNAVDSTSHLPSAPLEVTSMLPQNPAVLGGGEIGATGELSDFTSGGNPYHLVFQIEAGDPDIFNNNIPMQYCTAPSLSASKALAEQVAFLSSGETRLVYNLSVENNSLVPVNNVMITDDLADVFGSNQFSVHDLELVSAPVGVALNPNFNGDSNAGVLAGGITLEPTETISVRLTIDANISTSGTYTNVITTSGTSPLDGSAFAGDTAQVDTPLTVFDPMDQILINKVANVSTARVGDIIAYTITVTNEAPNPLIGTTIVDSLPVGLSYRPGSAQIAGISVEPEVQGRKRLVWLDQTVPANGSLVLTLRASVGPDATSSTFVNQAWLEDPTNGRVVTQRAEAIVRREAEPVFDCSEILGKVYDDINRNGYQDEGEPGLPGVRLATVRGELITTDRFGRYSVPCAAIPDADIGSNFTLKLDVRTLPTGYQVTTENPRAVRLTRGKMTELNFGAAVGRVVDIAIDARAFAGQSSNPSQALQEGVNALIAQLDGAETVLRISYRRQGETQALARQRASALTTYVERQWQRAGNIKGLSVEVKIIDAN